MQCLQAAVDDATHKKAKILYLLAKAKSITTSIDELTDMLATNSLPLNLKQIWDREGVEQLDIVRLNKSASRGLVEELKVETCHQPEYHSSQSGMISILQTFSTASLLLASAMRTTILCLTAPL